MLKCNNVLLHCAGLDTLATVTLNGHVIGQTDNMFRSWEFDVKEYLQPGDNEIEILFDSALRVGQEQLALHYIHSWSTDEHKLPGGNYIRKAAYHFGWDWGPKLVTCGIWRDIELRAFNTRLADVHITQDHSQAGQVTLHAQVQVSPPSSRPLTVTCAVAFGGQTVLEQESAVAGQTALFELPIAEPHLWWPNGLGQQPLV